VVNAWAIQDRGRVAWLRRFWAQLAVLTVRNLRWMQRQRATTATLLASPVLTGGMIGEQT